MSGSLQLWTTPSPVISDEMPTGFVILIMICNVLLILACCFFAYCVPLYIFYTEKPRRKFLYTYSKEDTQCCTVMCTHLSKSMISYCCPSLNDVIEQTDLYTKDFSHVQITQTGRTGSIFAYKDARVTSPVYSANHLQADESSRMLLPGLSQQAGYYA
jgi:hypothetical protein